MTHDTDKIDILHTIRLYSPLTVRMEDDDHSDLVVVPTYYAEMYTSDVEDALERDMDFDTPRVLMAYYHEQDSVSEKVFSFKPWVEYINGELHGVAVLECKAPLTPEEIAVIKDYVIGQWSDGFGEGFEQRPIRTPDGDLYISFWDADHFYMKTGDEMQREWENRRQNSRGGKER